MYDRPALTALAATVVVALAAAGAKAEPLAANSNSEMLRSYFETCLNDPAQYDCLGEYWIADKVERVAESEKIRRWAFPDLEYEVVEILVDGERAAVRCHVSGTPAPAAVVDADAAGPLDLEEAFFYVVRDGKIQSGLVISDRLSVAEAMGGSGGDSADGS